MEVPLERTVELIKLLMNRGGASAQLETLLERADNESLLLDHEDNMLALLYRQFVW